MSAKCGDGLGLFWVPMNATEGTAGAELKLERSTDGTDIVVNKNIITNDRGEVVQEAYTTLAGRSADEDGQGGFSDGAS